MFKRHQSLSLGLLLSVLGFSVNTQASELTIPNAFTAGTPARAAEVNANFTATAASVNDLETRVAQLEALLAAMGVTTGTDAQGNPVVIFSGVNVQINSGAGQTYSAPNGTGNLVIGYDEPRTTGADNCSVGAYNNQTDCEDNGGTWALSFKTGSHNLIVGPGQNYSQWGGIVGGLDNTVSANGASATAGRRNIAGGDYASVSGGSFNVAAGEVSSISGGYTNIANGGGSSISGGRNNTTNQFDSSVSGGANNTVSGDAGSISGGYFNVVTASGEYGSISGGYLNVVTAGQSGSISGGEGNTTSNTASHVSGGLNNTASGLSSTVSGGANRVAPSQNDWVGGSLLEDN